jgi:hypothetical protein
MQLRATRAAACRYPNPGKPPADPSPYAFCALPYCPCSCVPAEQLPAAIQTLAEPLLNPIKAAMAQFTPNLGAGGETTLAAQLPLFDRLATLFDSLQDQNLPAANILLQVGEGEIFWGEGVSGWGGSAEVWSRTKQGRCRLTVRERLVGCTAGVPWSERTPPQIVAGAVSCWAKSLWSWRTCPHVICTPR